MNSECHAKKFAFDFQLNKELLKDFNQASNINGFALLKDHSSFGVENEPREKGKGTKRSRGNITVIQDDCTWKAFDKCLSYKSAILTIYTLQIQEQNLCYYFIII